MRSFSRHTRFCNGPIHGRAGGPLSAKSFAKRSFTEGPCRIQLAQGHPFLPGTRCRCCSASCRSRRPESKAVSLQQPYSSPFLEIMCSRNRLRLPKRDLPKRKLCVIKEGVNCEERENSGFTEHQRGAVTGCKPPRHAPLGSPGSGPRERDGGPPLQGRQVPALLRGNAGGTAEGVAFRPQGDEGLFIILQYPRQIRRMKLYDDFY